MIHGIFGHSGNMQVVQLVAAVLLLAGNFFFVAVEFSVTRARPTMVSDVVERGAQGSGSLQHAVRHIDAYLPACQLGITVCSIGLGITAEPVVAHALESLFGGGTWLAIAATTVAFVLAYAVVSTFHVVLGELAPKSLAIARTESIGLMLAPPMRMFYLVTKPAVDLLNMMGNGVLKPFGIPPASEAGRSPHTETELRTLIGQSEREDILERIVGDIRDEYDSERERFIEHLSDGSVRVRGGAFLELVRSELDLDVAEHRGATLGGYLTETQARMPAPGEVLRLGHRQATVENLDGATITSVLLREESED